jgi:hypothetical protein
MHQVSLTIAQRDAIESRMAKRFRFDPPPQDDLARPVEGPCWTWTGTRSSGYGITYDGSRNVRTHRLMLLLAGVSLPPNRVVDHLCRNRACCNPDHLDIVTPSENSLRGAYGRSLSALRCHECGSVDGFIRTYGSGGRGWRCRPCARLKCAAYRRRKKEEKAANV